MLTPEALRAARGLLNWGVRDLAARAEVSWSTISQFENGRPMRETTAAKIVGAFAAQGVELVTGPGRAGAMLMREAAAKTANRTPRDCGKWVKIPVKDPRLKGWRPVFAYGPPGASTEVILAKPMVVAEGKFRESRLLVLVSVACSGGKISIQQFEVQSSNRVVLDQLLALGQYILKIAPGGNVIALEEQVQYAIEQYEVDQELNCETELLVQSPNWKAGDGPSLGPEEIFDFIVLNEIRSSLDWIDGGARMEIGVLDHMLDRAYRLGRRVREAEFPSDSGRTRTAKAALRRTMDAQTWWSDGAKWAQQLIDAWPAGWRNGQRLSLNGLGLQMEDAWRERPFSAGPASVDGRDLATRVLPQWHAEGMIKFPKKRA